MNEDIPCNNCGVKFSEYEKLKQENKELEKKYDELLDQFGDERADYNMCLLENKKLRECVEFYADIYNYEFHYKRRNEGFATFFMLLDEDTDIMPPPNYGRYGGKKARQTLKKLNNDSN